MVISQDERESFETALSAALIAMGKLDQRSLDRALRVRSNGAESVLHLLTKLGFVSERDMAEAIANQLSLPLVGPRDYPTQPVLEDLVTNRFLREARVLPLVLEGNDLILAMADPLDHFT